MQSVLTDKILLNITAISTQILLSFKYKRIYTLHICGFIDHKFFFFLIHYLQIKLTEFFFRDANFRRPIKSSIKKKEMSVASIPAGAH